MPPKPPLEPPNPPPKPPPIPPPKPELSEPPKPPPEPPRPSELRPVTGESVDGAPPPPNSPLSTCTTSPAIAFFRRMTWMREFSLGGCTSSLTIRFLMVRICSGPASTISELVRSSGTTLKPPAGPCAEGATTPSPGRGKRMPPDSEPPSAPMIFSTCEAKSSAKASLSGITSMFCRVPWMSRLPMILSRRSML